MTVVALLLAAGEGIRLGAARPGALPKVFLALGGRPMFEHSLRSMASSGVVDRVILVAHAAHLDGARDQVSRRGWGELVASVVAGGPSRQDSVRRGIDALDEDFAAVLCHDAARPFASPELFRRVVGRLVEDEADGVVPAVGTADTVKRVREGWVVETMPREGLVLAQTPQGFRAPALRQAHRVAEERSVRATDDAMLLEAAGFRVAVVAGEPANFKITTQEDLARAEQVLASFRTVEGADA
jgi:2-C-methyl-D-erythritol 4-phosphate cytidylyltransferase